MPGQNTLIAFGVGVVLLISSTVWALLERSGRLRWKAESESVAAMLKSCQSAAERQNKAIEEVQAKMSALKKKSQAAAAAARTNSAQYAKEHARLQLLINSPMADTSCDTAWSQIEGGK